MASLDFPASPTTGQLFSAANGVTYRYDGVLWLVQAGPGGGTGDFMASPSANFTLSSTPAVLVFNTASTGNSGGWYNTSTGRYTPPAGRYHITAQLSGTSTSGATSITVQLRKNGVAWVDSQDTTSSASFFAQPTVDAIIDSNGTDYWEVWAFANAGTTTTSGRFMASPLTGMQGPMGPSGNMLINGAGAPTGLSAAKGTLYINTTATTTTTRLYINTDGGTTWANFTASA